MLLETIGDPKLQHGLETGNYRLAACGRVKVMGDFRILQEELATLQRLIMEERNIMAIEKEFLGVVKNFEEVRKSWLHADLELKKYKELLVKSDVAKAALEIRLMHARNQLDVEMKKRHKTEADYQYLERQMQLMCDILVQDGKSRDVLNDEQRSLLATFEQKGANMTLYKSNKRLSAIDESSFLSHSDISYDRTDDDVDFDATFIKPLRSRVRERRRSSMVPVAEAPVGKRIRDGNFSADSLDRKAVEKEVETIVKASVMTPDAGAKIHTTLGISRESPDDPAWSVTQECVVSVGGDQTPYDHTSRTRVQSEDRILPISRAQETLKHTFLSKTVIRPETCTPCGKRIHFGKMAVKCRNCHVVAHPGCKQKLSDSCFSWEAGCQAPAVPDLLEAFAPLTHPRVPQLILDCVAEIERRGLNERGLYRVPGGERAVKDLRLRVLRGKPGLMLREVQDIHVVCGLLKDFLRRLNEPLVTFRLHRTFMEAAELDDNDKGAAVLYRVISELPKTNRDTLAFLMLHLHRVIRSPQCQMDQNNLARVFGPTLVGHGMSEPTPTTIMSDTSIQPKVILRLLSLPEDYWNQILTIQTGQNPPASCSGSGSGLANGFFSGRFFPPVTSPELRSHKKSSQESGSATSGMGRAKLGRFFPSPN
ncbi:rac GTPase-activating protein 1 isoform X2 [Nothobranchius furzeri]|uniref:Si:ch1073-416j23.1 n=2 Tax=Nothobranchius furzeri TaxID=105023 RepID=A0A8C6K920_NOTFU|nr:rac GTPase-activating protein 1 isoform X2 [Nothobranchius furzeri]